MCPISNAAWWIGSRRAIGSRIRRIPRFPVARPGRSRIGEIALGEEGEEVFKQGISLIWKKQVVNRVYDKANDTLIYLSHSRQVQDGSAKMSITTIPLFGQDVVWEKGKPQ